MARGDRSVDVFVRKLRQKLEKLSPQWRYVHTHFGVGYRFAAELADGTQPASAPERGFAAELVDEMQPASAPEREFAAKLADGSQPASEPEQADGSQPASEPEQAVASRPAEPHRPALLPLR